jgi:hypothetical protein
MKHITIAVDDELFRQARIYAAQRSTTLTELVRNFLLNLKFSPEDAPGRRVPTSQNRIAADKTALRIQKLLAQFGEAE